MSTPKQKISALIITYNVMGLIDNCIDSFCLADEFIVVDSYSTDGTLEYLYQRKNVKVIQRSFQNFTDQKSFALQQATNDWILFVDADEVVTASLQKEIIDAVNSKNAASAYWFYRKFIFKNKRLNFSGWQTDKNHRLFRKSKAKFTNEKIVHETLQIDGESKCLTAKLTHYCYKNYQDYKGKMLHYGRLRALEEYRKGKQFSYLKMTVKPAWKFFYNFVVRLGFLDLGRGITVCYLNALSVYTRYAELRKLEQEELTPVITRLKDMPNFQLSEKRLAS